MKWEYLFVVIDEQSLDRFGEDRWELVQYSHNTGAAIFKRPKKDSSDD